MKGYVSKENEGLYFYMEKQQAQTFYFLQNLHVFISLIFCKLYGLFIGASATEYKQRKSKHEVQ